MNKFEQLIEYVINDDESKARELFHDIVVEKSREIYESLMDEETDAERDDKAEKAGEKVAKDIEYDEMHEDATIGGDASDDLIADVETEEEGISMEDEEIEMDAEEEMVDGDDDMGDAQDEADIEDRVVDLEDKLDQLMAEFEELMGSDDEGMDMGDDEMSDMGDDEMGDDEMSPEEMMEAVQLQKVSVTHGDNGVQTKSPGLVNSGQAGMDSKPVKFSGAAETVPTGPKGATNAYSKGETSVKGAGSFKNAPGHKSQDLDKAPAPSKGDNGVNAKSPVAESRTAKKRI
jgi:hypothetical protein